MTSMIHKKPVDRRVRRVVHGLSILVAGALLATALSGCGCRPGYVGPYGGIHPGHCWIG